MYVRRDSNPEAIAGTSPSSWRVFHFHHGRMVSSYDRPMKGFVAGIFVGSIVTWFVLVVGEDDRRRRGCPVTKPAEESEWAREAWRLYSQD